MASWIGDEDDSGNGSNRSSNVCSRPLHSADVLSQPRSHPFLAPPSPHSTARWSPTSSIKRWTKFTGSRPFQISRLPRALRAGHPACRWPTKRPTPNQLCAQGNRPRTTLPLTRQLFLLLLPRPRHPPRRTPGGRRPLSRSSQAPCCHLRLP